MRIQINLSNQNEIRSLSTFILLGVILKFQEISFGDRAPPRERDRVNFV